VELALEVDAAGVHIGDDDISIKYAREILKDKIIGVSCYGSIDKAINYQENGADYVAFGTCFSSPTKPNAPIIDLDIFHNIKDNIKIPICAIGGINKDNIHFLKNQIDMIAVISSIWCGDIHSNIKNLRYNFDRN